MGRAQALNSLGAREQSRWVTIDEFDTIPLQLRVDGAWLNGLDRDSPADAIIELQPVLSRVEADRVMRAIADLLAAHDGQRLVSVGTDFSGRYWFRGKIGRQTIRSIAKDFFSVQAIHSPLYSVTTAGRIARNRPTPVRQSAIPDVDIRSLPCVAVVDLGVPTDHVYLAAYRRGQFVPQGAGRNANDHGSFVASRVVFGDCSTAEKLAAAHGECSFYDVVVGEGYENRINDKLVMDALRGVQAGAPDVRVFNLSFGDYRPLAEFDDVERRERRLELQDLDNFACANDVLIVVAAGNAPPGMIPRPAYPDHHTDDRWALGPWACGYNTLVCGSYVSRIAPHGLVKQVGQPSPFTRVGGGVCDSPVPTFCAPGGNSDESYNVGPDLGVWGFSESGLAEDRMGTSFAAPILARQAALALHSLQAHCAPGTQPFAVTARAFLALTAKPTTNSSFAQTLASLTLGLGEASAGRLIQPQAGSAVILWQGHIESPNDKVRVQVPVPQEWLVQASAPVLRLVVAYDPPVNAASTALWACRRVSVTLHIDPDSRGVVAPARAHATYPLFRRDYKLARHKDNVTGDVWVLELQYEEVFEYPPGMEFDPRQRVAVAAELVDDGADAVDPQEALQGLPIAAGMNRLSVQQVGLRSPVLIRNRRS